MGSAVYRDGGCWVNGVGGLETAGGRSATGLTVDNASSSEDCDNW